nr:hypothetical protein Iba_chr12cCG15960 [Ipomoea batatas]GMD68705.1 hypothetical protein Iba_chr12dCG11790 [Ipomoea batatas]
MLPIAAKATPFPSKHSHSPPPSPWTGRAAQSDSLSGSSLSHTTRSGSNGRSALVIDGTINEIVLQKLGFGVWKLHCCSGGHTLRHKSTITEMGLRSS